MRRVTLARSLVVGQGQGQDQDQSLLAGQWLCARIYGVVVFRLFCINRYLTLSLRCSSRHAAQGLNINYSYRLFNAAHCRLNVSDTHCKTFFTEIRFGWICRDIWNAMQRCGIWGACRIDLESDNDNEEQHKYVCITTNQPDTKSNPNPNPNPTTKQHA